MDAEELQRIYLDYKASLVNEGILDDDQFFRLQQLQSNSKPNFVILFDILTMFFEETEKYLNELDIALNVDFKRAGFVAKTMNGCCSSIGVKKLRDACIPIRKFCEERNIEQCLRCVHELKEEYTLVKNKLERLLLLEKQILDAGGSIPK